MRLTKNKRGMYEYIMTKSIMLIFIMALVYLFYSFYNEMLLNSAWKVANSEAETIAKKIDDTIGYKGVATTSTLILEPEIKVGKEYVRYNLTITPGRILIRLIDYPYLSVRGIGAFGMGKLEGTTRGESYITCSWEDLSSGTSTITVEKTQKYEFYMSSDYGKRCAGKAPGPDGLTCYIVTVELGASESCGEFMEMEGEWVA
jgi:hypothetical protein